MDSVARRWQPPAGKLAGRRRHHAPERTGRRTRSRRGAGCARSRLDAGEPRRPHPARRDRAAGRTGRPHPGERPGMNRNLWLLAVLQGLFLTNNVTFIAINGLVGLQLAPYAWMATLPVMGYVVGSALFTGTVARSQARFGRKRAFQSGLAVAIGS